GVARRGIARHRRRLRHAPAREARRAAADSHSARRWVHAEGVRRSLRARLVAAAAGSILIAVGIFGVAAVAITNHQLHSPLDRALRQRAHDVARLASSAPAVLTSPGALESPAGGRQVVVEVFDARNRILARSVALGARLLPPDPAIERARRSGRAGY